MSTIYTWTYLSLKKGGAAVLVKKDKFNDVQVMNEKLLMKCNCSGCLVESVFLKLSNNNNTVYVNCIYRHPNGNANHFNDSLSELLTNHPMKNQDISIIGGDINIDLLKTNYNPTKNYFDTMTSNNFISNIVAPT